MAKINYFDLFGLVRSFEIDLKALDKSYFRLQSKYHPDKIGMNYENDQYNKMLQISLVVNEAYKILKSPVSRAEYLLKLHNDNFHLEQVNINHDILEKSIHDREHLKGLKGPDAISAFNKEILAQTETSIEKITYYFLIQNYNQVAMELINLKFLTKLLEEIKNRMRY